MRNLKCLVYFYKSLVLSFFLFKYFVYILYMQLHVFLFVDQKNNERYLLNTFIDIEY